MPTAPGTDDDGRFVSTGLDGLDEILGGLRLGDNVVWRTSGVDDYREFVAAFAARSRASGRRVVYIRFARHPPVLNDTAVDAVYGLDALDGFEPFTLQLHTLIAREGSGVFYVFDCLSDLLDAWATDRMIGNFFRVTCPYLFDLDTVACFALDRAAHSFATVDAIRATTQVLIDLYNDAGTRYVHPLKVWQRSAATMFLPHREVSGRFLPITASAEATRLFTRLAGGSTSQATRHLDFWERLFLHAADVAADPARAAERGALVDQMCRLLIGRDERVRLLARRFFTPGDLLAIKARLVGTGFIGGKAVGMLLGRAILEAEPGAGWHEVLEPHDSWYIGSDLFHAYIIHNGWWRLLMAQRAAPGPGETSARLRDLMLTGAFPDDIVHEFRQMLEYFGQSPIIVRSSSLLEDGFGNAFAGKYDSVFCVNQGSPESRLAQFLAALRTVYASTLSDDALDYRQARGLSHLEEQMALLVQRVSGVYAGAYFLPPLAGVGVSCNTYVWREDMDPDAGMLRLVVGLGTRAVDRTGDYPRIVALDRPLLVPHADPEQRRRYTQHDVDVLDIGRNVWRTVPLAQLPPPSPMLPLDLLADDDGRGGRVVTFDRLLAETELAAVFSRMLRTLERAYDYPVDIEFTGAWDGDGRLLLNLIQCRPLQTRGVQSKRVDIAEAPDGLTVFRGQGNFMGGSLAQPIARAVVIDAAAFTALPLSDKYEVARLVGRLNRIVGAAARTPTMLIGPGRWGTSTPQLGVPVRFAEVSAFVAIVEVAFAPGGMQPELSFGSHFFQDLVETGIFYVALDPARPECLLNVPLITACTNRLEEWLPDDARLAHVVHVADLPPGCRLLADVVSQRVACLSATSHML
jgi:hypothetical protein